MEELSKGLYKLKKDNHYHLMRVEGYGATKKCFIDHSSFATDPREISEEYKVIKKYTIPPEVFNYQIIVKFQDQDLNEFSFTVRDAWVLRDIFEMFPWLKEPFNYKKSKSRISTGITGEYMTEGVFNHEKRKK